MADRRAPHRRWRPHLSVRAKATIAAAGVFALVLTFAALASLLAQRHALMDSTSRAAAARAQTTALALGGDVPAGLVVRAGPGEFVQVVGPGNTVELASPYLSGAPPLAPGSWPALIARRPGERAEFLAQRAAIREGGLTGGHVIVGVGLNQVRASMATLTRTYAIGVPALTAVAALITWVLVGAALRPVDTMRRQAEEIGSARLHVRLPVPGGRDEIARLAATLNRMLDRLEAGHRAQRRFVSDASHELRSPLAAIRQSAEVARDYPGTVTTHELAEVALAEGERLERLSEGLLFLARADEAAGTPARERVEIGELLAAEARRQAGSGANPRASFETDGCSPAAVRGDRALLARAIRNLTDNAERHATRIALSCREEANHVIVAIDDDGPGVPAAERTRIFERFVRLDEARASDDGGSGLGLAIVREIVTSHGGEVEVGDSPLGGARFTVRLPRWDQAEEPFRTLQPPFSTETEE